MGHLLGYARVSTLDQSVDSQVDELQAAGCYEVFVEHAGGTRADRPELAKALASLRPGDSLVVWRLDRLARSLAHLIQIANDLEERGVEFRSLREQLDTTTPGGKLVFHLMGSLAQFERELIRERTVAGLAAARARGRNGGRPTVMTEAKIADARKYYAQGMIVAAPTTRSSTARLVPAPAPLSTPATGN